jgi:hypothetical protein
MACSAARECNLLDLNKLKEAVGKDEIGAEKERGMRALDWVGS